MHGTRTEQAPAPVVWVHSVSPRELHFQAVRVPRVAPAHLFRTWLKVVVGQAAQLLRVPTCPWPALPSEQFLVHSLWGSSRPPSGLRIAWHLQRMFLPLVHPP